MRTASAAVPSAKTTLLGLAPPTPSEPPPKVETRDLASRPGQSPHEPAPPPDSQAGAEPAAQPTSPAQLGMVAKISERPVADGAPLLTLEGETLRPNEMDRRPSLPAPKRGRALTVAFAAAVTVLVLGASAYQLRTHSAARSKQARTAEPEHRVVSPSSAKESLVGAVASTDTAATNRVPDERPAPGAPSAAGSAATPVPPQSPEAAAASASASAQTPIPSSVPITVRVKPAGSILFDRGKRIGTNVVQISLEPGQKKQLVALRDGYQPRRFVVDGSTNPLVLSLTANPNKDAAVVPAPAAPATAGR